MFVYVYTVMEVGGNPLRGQTAQELDSQSIVQSGFPVEYLFMIFEKG